MVNETKSLTADDDKTARVREVIDNCLRRRAAGEAIADDAVIASHPELMPDLGEDLRKLQLIAGARVMAAQPIDPSVQTRSHRDSDTGSGHLEVRCPSCHAAMKIAVDTQLTDLTCAACGSHFSLVDQSKATRLAPSLTSVGRFELIERLGIGAFGSVWKARDKELDRTVAIKIPRASGMSAEQQEKFFREARAAAQLRHPSIVSVHEVGHDGESVYIVSDFVRGVTLGDWLTARQLSNREAADLCAKIADALEHAHEQGVVHRDLKPANIMIDGDLQPHLMDFGLARRDVGEVTVTMDGQVLGTPAYMSPEQAQGEAHTADRRSDVYSLGVILFQLLTSELPFRGNARMLMHQVIHDEAPSPRKLNSTIARDLETVTLKCIEKDPSRRYQTAKELAAELRRFLTGKPINARPITKVERFGRWVRLHKSVTALSATVALVLLIGTGVSTYFAVDARRQANVAVARENDALSAKTEALAAQQDAVQRQKEAELARKEAEAVTQFLVETFRSPDPERDGYSITVAEVLQRGEQRLGKDLSAQPLVSASVLYAIGASRLSLGLSKEAIDPLVKAMQLREKELGKKDAETISIMIHLAQAYRGVGQLNDAILLYEQIVDAHRHEFGPAHPQTLLSVHQLAHCLADKGRFDEAIANFEFSFQARKDALGADHPNTLEWSQCLASAYLFTGRFEDVSNLLDPTSRSSRVPKIHQPADANSAQNHDDATITLKERTLAARRDKLGADHPDTMHSMHALAFAYGAAGRWDEAIALFKETVDARGRTLGPDHPDTFDSLWRLSRMYVSINRNSEAMAIREKMLPGALKSLGPDHPITIWTMQGIAPAFLRTDRFDEAINLYEKLLQVQSAKYGPTHVRTLQAMNDLASAYRDTGRVYEALELYGDVLVQRRSTLGADHSDTLDTVSDLAYAYKLKGELSKAIPLYQEYHAAVVKKLGPNHADALRAMNDLAYAFKDSNRFGDAVPLFKDALIATKTISGPTSPETLQSIGELAYAYKKTNQLQMAVPLYEEALAIVRKLRGSQHSDTLQTLRDLAYAYRLTNNHAKALPLCEEVLRTSKDSLGAEHPTTNQAAETLAFEYELAGELKQSFSVYSSHAFYSESLKLANLLGAQFVDRLMEVAAAHQGEKTPNSIDALVLGELRLVMGKADSAETSIRVAIAARETEQLAYKSLGWCLLAQGKADQAKDAFEQALNDRRRKDGTFDLDGADRDHMTAAYFLDLVSDDQYVSQFAADQESACLPWFYVAQRREIAGDKNAAITAYDRCIEIGKDARAHSTRSLANWRRRKLIAP